MQKSTISALNQLNTDFYTTVAPDFDDSRNHFWPGWHTLLKHLGSTPAEVTSVLDIGCGNGRFGTFCEQYFPHLQHYHGIDGNDTLIAAARKNTTLSLADFSTQDIVATLLEGKKLITPQKNYSLVALFGVMHHIPSFQLRAELLTQAAELLEPNGVLAVTTWQFMEFERFTKKITAVPANIPTEQLEPNDYFLDWNRGAHAIRYCHFHTNEESEALFKTAGLKLLKSFTADGREGNVNTYYLLQKTSA